jgi:branched-chain amino acid transport system ATP-binding protein
MTDRLAVTDLHAGYGKVEVLRGVDLTVGAGEIVAVLGANGAGKTTLLRAISGLLRPPRGEVRLNGDIVNGQAAEQLVARGVAHVPEGRLVFPGLTVRENLMLGAYSRRSRAEIARDERWVLDLFPRLAERLGQPAGTLSGGEQQMLAIGRGLMSAPSVLLLDEPTVGIAPLVVAEMFQTLAALRSERGLSMLLVEQNVAAALRVATRAYVLDRGGVVASGGAEQMRGDSRVAATYLGAGWR